MIACQDARDWCTYCWQLQQRLSYTSLLWLPLIVSLLFNANTTTTVLTWQSMPPVFLMPSTCLNARETNIYFSWLSRAHVSMSPWNCSAVHDGQLYTYSRSQWPSTSAFCHSAEVGHTSLSTEQFRSSLPFCGGPVDLEFAARQSSWPRTESQYFQTSAEDIHFCEILMTKCIKRIRDLFEYVLYKFTLYLLTLPTVDCCASIRYLRQGSTTKLHVLELVFIADTVYSP